MEREKFSSRLGFILISAGCAIGLGNVWRFPYIVGKYGGAAFVLIYLAFLLVLGLPIVVMEFAVGRASKKSAALSFDLLEPKGSKWHLTKYIAMAGNYMLMMFYTTVAGWMLLYFFKMLRGDFNGLDSAGTAEEFSKMLADHDSIYGCHCSGMLYHLRAGTCIRRRAYHKDHDAPFVPFNGGIGRSFGTVRGRCSGS